MKSQLITILSVVGVLGTAGAAMAINSDALSSVPSGSIGGATQVLVPASDNKALETPEPKETPTTSPSPAAIHTQEALSPDTSSNTTSPKTYTEGPEAPHTESPSPTPKPTHKDDDAAGGHDD